MSNGLSITQWLIVFASVVLIALPDSQPFAEAALEVTQKNTNATALVTEKKLDLKIETGIKSDYSSAKKFDLIVGGCKLSIDAIPGTSTITFNVNGDFYESPTSLTITDSDVKISYTKGTSPNLCTSSAAKFEEKDGKILLEVKLSGDIPSKLKLSSSADTYNPSGDNEGGLSAGAIAGISAGGVVGLLALVGGGVGGFFGYRAYKRKKQAKLNDKAQLKTAVNVENGLASKSTTLDKSKLKDDKSKKDERKEKKERRKESKEKERSESVKKSKSDKKKDDAKSSKEPARNAAEEAKQKAKEEAIAKEPIYAPLVNKEEELSQPPPKE